MHISFICIVQNCFSWLNLAWPILQYEYTNSNIQNYEKKMIDDEKSNACEWSCSYQTLYMQQQQQQQQ